MTILVKLATKQPKWVFAWTKLRECDGDYMWIEWDWMDYIWIIYGLYMDYIWIIYGLYVIIWWLYVDCDGIESGVFWVQFLVFAYLLTISYDNGDVSSLSPCLFLHKIGTRRCGMRVHELRLSHLQYLGVSIVMGVPQKLDGLFHGKSINKNGWELGVPPFQDGAPFISV